MATPLWPSLTSGHTLGSEAPGQRGPCGYLGTAIVTIQCPILPQTNWISPRASFCKAEWPFHIQGTQLSLDRRPDTRDGVGGVSLWE